MTESRQPIVAGLLLAAGGSKRLGQPKQLLEFEGRTLIRRAAEALIGAGCSPVVVVLGAEVERSQQELGGHDVEIVINDSWESGMGLSIAFGMRSVLAFETLPDAVLISLCDQPLVSAEKLRSFIAAFGRSQADVIAAHYNDVAGVPALFSAHLFRDLAALTGERGARDLIRHSAEAETIPLPEAGFDIDSPADIYKRF